jgi:hypothetical protein
MIRFYSIFISDDDLFTSPYVHRLNFFHDVTLSLGKSQTIHFLLQAPLTVRQEEMLEIINDPLSLELEKVDIKTYKHQTIVSVTVRPKEIGTAKIGLAYPQSEPLYKKQMSGLPSKFKTTRFGSVPENALASTV